MRQELPTRSPSPHKGIENGTTSKARTSPSLAFSGSLKNPETMPLVLWNQICRVKRDHC